MQVKLIYESHCVIDMATRHSIECETKRLGLGQIFVNNFLNNRQFLEEVE